MRVDVDQSGRVDRTDQPTVLALANGSRYTIRISAAAKREVIKTLRQGGQSGKTLYILMFSTLLYLLLVEKIDSLSSVVIDTELLGHEPTIKVHVLNLFRRRGKTIESEVLTFRQIGKHSPAHATAIGVFRREIMPDREITAQELLAEFEK